MPFVLKNRRPLDYSTPYLKPFNLLPSTLLKKTKEKIQTSSAYHCLPRPLLALKLVRGYTVVRGITERPRLTLTIVPRRSTPSGNGT